MVYNYGEYNTVFKRMTLKTLGFNPAGTAEQT